MSESVACGLEYLDNDATQQTHFFTRMIDQFFDCLNAKRSIDGQIEEERLQFSILNGK